MERDWIGSLNLNHLQEIRRYVLLPLDNKLFHPLITNAI
jgi:hypothetical protein